ncbi:hypothetical protein DVR12_19060 [Chitinophaga silvatica]|uniref:Lipocalin-like domain-containing protein n=1 Tax=Chitinophaga silvatica TaxID=2282649 RepID=A0A3E1Y6X4_9BACT|nr:hypothetical protein [Chitinophaga silvatica]RFS20661.1 hypothetical protein DVR12_19060 [Chitinophaga silvatica]
MIKKLIGFLLSIVLVLPALGQQKQTNPVYLTNKQLAGVWQIGSKEVGSGVGQNFRFSEDGRFTFNTSDPNQDLIVIRKLQGKYRIDKDELYFTITSKTIIENGEIVTADNFESNVFSIEGKDKVIAIPNPKELNGCVLTVISPTHIRIINVDYYKLDLKKYHINKDDL